MTPKTKKDVQYNKYGDIFANEHYGALISFLLENDKIDYRMQEVRPFIKTTTWAARGKKEFKKWGFIDYPEKKGGRNKFKVDKLELKYRLVLGFRQYVRKIIFPAIRKKVASYFREYLNTTLPFDSLLSHRKKYKNKYILPVFHFFLELETTGNKHQRNEMRISYLEEKYMRLVADEDHPHPETEFKVIEKEIETLKKNQNSTLYRTLKKKEKNIPNSLSEIKQYFDKRILTPLEDDLEKKNDASEIECIYYAFITNVPFLRSRLKKNNVTKFSAYDVYCEMMVRFAITYRLRKSDKSLNKYMRNYYRIARLYEMMVVTDFEAD